MTSVDIRPRRFAAAPILLLAVLAGCAPAIKEAPATVAQVPEPTSAQRCVALAGTALLGGTATVADAAIVAANAALPEYCVAHVQLADSSLRIEAQLPATGWNRKLAFLGGGAFDGMLVSVAQPYFSESIIAERYATATTNGGYDFPGPFSLDYFKASFAYDATKLADYTFRSEHRALPFAKALVAAYYGAAPERSYFEGCSMGGHDGMIQAQRFPADFDGIVARAPAGNVIGLMLQFHRIAQHTRVPEAVLDAAGQALLAKAVLARCDDRDGVADGIIADPARCKFDPASLRCAGGANTGDACFSDRQLATIAAITSPVATSDQAWSHPGYPFGGEDSPKGWGEYIWPSPALGGASLQGLFSDGFVRSFVTRDPDFDTTTWRADDWLAPLSLVGSQFNATDPDLAALRARGAKLIVWNGTTDSSVSVLDNTRYYERVVAAMGQAAADETLELFLAPGVGHCFGGPGPDQVDLMRAMATWVEQGTAPSKQRLVQRKLDADGNTILSRPLCKYPAYARYRGTGDINDAAQFDCSTP